MQNGCTVFLKFFVCAVSYSLLLYILKVKYRF
jgi:hypothetical protein